MAQKRTVKRGEVLVETLQFPEPLSLRDKRLRADDENRRNVHARAEFPDDEASLDGLADTDFIRDEQARTIRADELQHRAVLVGDELDAARPQRE